MNNFVTLEQAKILKEIGFNIIGEHIYDSGKISAVDILSFLNSSKKDNCFPAPRYRELVKWFYNEKGLWITTKPYVFENEDKSVSVDYRYCVYDTRDYAYDVKTGTYKMTVIYAGSMFKTPDEAIFDAIDNILEYLKDKR